MTDKEKEAIERLNRYKKTKILYGNTFAMHLEQLNQLQNDIETVLNLIQTQQAEIEKKDKMTNEMSENVEKAIEYMEHYIKAEPNNENVKCEFREVIEILKGKSNEV